MRVDGVTLLVGTTKGVFLVSGNAGRDTWSVDGPFCDGWPINHVVGDTATRQIWAGGGGDWHGAGVWRSDDLGRTWALTKLTNGAMDHWAANDPGFAQAIGWTDTPAPFASAFSQVWSLGLAHGTLFAGTKPANLLKSTDGGLTWAMVPGLTDHHSSHSWVPGATGLLLHTIVGAPADPQKLWVGISSAGVFATEDGGATWDQRNQLTGMKHYVHSGHPSAPCNGEIGHCVHNMVRAPGDEDVLYQQNHHGVLRSGDGGRSWDDITTGLPSPFGFPIRVHPHDPNTIWTLPLNGDTSGRFPPDAAAAVWRSRDGGQSWQALRQGLPQEACFFTVLRQAMGGDTRDPAGIYLGTNSGSIFASVDEGENWQEIARHLPTILAVEAID